MLDFYLCYWILINSTNLRQYHADLGAKANANNSSKPRENVPIILHDFTGIKWNNL